MKKKYIWIPVLGIGLVDSHEVPFNKLMALILYHVFAAIALGFFLSQF